MNNEKPKFFLIFKIIGFIALGIGIFGFIKLITGFGDFDSNNYLIGMFLGPFGIFAAISCLVIGFRPEITKMNTKSIKYVQEENKEDLKDIATSHAEIHSEAISNTVDVIKESINETIFCKHCGKKIDANSIFCKYCGKKL